MPDLSALHPYFDYLIWAWVAMAIILVPIQLKVAAPYGRHTKTKGWGPLIPSKTGWVLMEIISPVLLALFFFSGPNSHHAPYIFMASLWLLHYLNRSVIWPLRIRSAGKVMPVSIMFSAIFFNVVNTFFNGYYLGHLAPLPPENFFTQASTIIGVIVMATGAFINIRSDNILINLRKPGESGYKTPQGFLFRYVSSPNLLGEMIEWCGFAILCLNLPALSFAIWTICNLAPRAIHHHRWCQQNLQDYPSERKAFLPGII